jgi:NADH-quinone oxidoreductase subunit L
MVTAGVYLVARAHPVFDHAPVAAEIVAVVGAATLLFAASIGCVQYDIKRVLAYSTMSQIGYMILAVGVGAYEAGAFHFTTHAYFKALLFMAAGIVIHNLSGEQDIRNMGGLAKRMPFAYWTFLAGTLAIAGIFPFAGFFSKDAVLDQVLRTHHPLLYAAAVAGAFLTAFYMFRLLFLTFFGDYRGAHEPHGDRVWTMSIPVGVLVALSLVGGWLVLPNHDVFGRLIAPSFADSRFAQSLGEFNWQVSLGTLILAIAGIMLAYALYRAPSNARAWLRQTFPSIRALLQNAYYFDVIYHYAFEVPTYALADACARFIEPDVIGGIPRVFTQAASWLGDVAGGWETGYLRRYGLTIVVGVVLMLAYYLYILHAASSMGNP